MYKTKTYKALAFLIALATIFSCSALGAGEEIVILYTNDLHGESLAKIATMVAELRKIHPDLLLVDAGDLFSGTPVSNVFKGEAEQAAVLKLGFNALAIGNHDFDFGLDRLKNSITAGVPWVSANIMQEDGRPFAQPFVIEKVGDTRILVVGMTTTATPRMSFPKNVEGLTFTDPTATLERILKQTMESYDICIVLSHLGYGEDLLLAQRVPGITAIIGGHSHTILRKPVRIGNTLITQSGSSARYLGKIVIQLKEGFLAQGELLEVPASTPPHPAFALIDDYYGVSLAVEMDRAIGSTSRGFTKNGMGLLLNKALLDFSYADAAIYNAGGVRDGLPRGPITKGDVFAVEPFGNEVVVVTLAGPDFAELLQIKAKRASDFYEGPKLIDLDRNYTVVTSDFLASEGSNYPMLAGGRISHLGATVREVLENYLQNHVLEQMQKEGTL